MVDSGPLAGSEPRLVERLRDEIMASPEQRITFARFMERALAEPGLGYYATSELRPTRSGDFLTAPELHPFFGRCIGRFITSAWKEAGSPERYRVHEYGAGRGALRDDAVAELGAPADWRRVDLPGRSDEAEGAPDVVVANEYLDALPVHRVVQDVELLEAWVGWRDGWFAETLGAPSTPDLAAYLQAGGIELRPGQRAEISLAAPAWMLGVAADLRPGGVILVIDYGHAAAELYGPRRMAGSLLTYREHRVSDDPFSAVGHTDITAHVDSSALERAADAAGLRLLGSTTHGRFLAALGLGELLAELGRRPDTDATTYLEARAAVARLLDPRHLGNFRVLVWARPRTDGTAPMLTGLDVPA